MIPDLVVLFERSGRCRDAFRQLGVNALSVDLQPTMSPGPHLQCDWRNAPRAPNIIAFPPCRFLTAAGAYLWPVRLVEQEKVDAKVFCSIEELG